MSTIPSVVQGATGTVLTLTWADATGAAHDLTGATITGVIRNKATGESRAIAGTLALSTPTSGIFTWTLAAGDVAEAGAFEVQFKATVGAAYDLTFVADWTVTVVLTATDARVLVAAENCYCTLDWLRLRLGIAPGARDAELLECIAAASRQAEQLSGRRFWTEIATKYFDAPWGNTLVLPDVLSVTAVTTDSERDGTWDGETWTELTDYWLEPRGSYPKTELRSTPWGNYSWYRGAPQYLKITGTWGAGDLQRLSPWQPAGVTVTVADAATVDVTLSAAGAVQAGHTLLVETEQMFVLAVNGLSATCKRGVNGTTAAAHTAASASVALYPDDVRTGTLWLAVQTWREIEAAGYESERIGDYSYKIAHALTEGQRLRMFGRVRRTAL